MNVISKFPHSPNTKIGIPSLAAWLSSPKTDYKKITDITAFCHLMGAYYQSWYNWNSEADVNIKNFPHV